MHQHRTRFVLRTADANQFGERTLGRVSTRITKDSRTDLGAGNKVGVVNNLLHSLFKQVDVFLKEKQVTQTTETHEYRAYLETLLNYGHAAKKSQLMASLYHKEKAGKMDTTNLTLGSDEANQNAGYVLSKESGTIEMSRTIKTTDVHDRSSPAQSKHRRVFCDVFHSKPGSKSEINRRVSQTAQSENQSERLGGARIGTEERTCHLSRQMRGVKCFIVLAGNPSLRKDNIFNGLVPKSFVFGLVDSAAFSGSYKKHPLKQLKTSKCVFDCSNRQRRRHTVQTSTTFLRQQSQQYIEAYTTLFSSTGKMYHDVGNDISREEFPNGYAIYAYDLTPDI